MEEHGSMSLKGKKISVLDSGFVVLVDWMGDDAAIPQAARVSYQKGTKSVRSDEDLIRFLMRHEHYSPFAMCQVKLYLRLPLFVFGQWVRHDRFAFNCMSARYSEMPTEKWEPREQMRGQSDKNKQKGEPPVTDEVHVQALGIIADANESAEVSYNELLQLGICREQARTVLPAGQYTECFVTANLGDWMLFLKQRLDPHAQREIQVYAEAVLEILTDLFPMSMQAFLDYQVNGVTLSKEEMEVLRYLIQENNLGTDLVNASNGLLSKREHEEFLGKIKV